MAKFGGFPGMGGGNMNNLLRQAQKMQADMEKTQADIEAKEFDVTSGGGAVTITMNGKKKVKDIFIDEKINKEDRNSYPILVDSNDTILWIPGIKKSKYDRLKMGKYDIIVWCTKEENNE